MWFPENRSRQNNKIFLLTLILCKLTCQYANFQSMATVPTPGPCAMGEASESGKEQNEVVDVEVITLGTRFKVSDVP